MSDTGGWAGPDPQGRPEPGSERPAPPPPLPPNFGVGYGKPGVIPLRPLSVGEILDGAVTTMRRHPALVFGVSAIVAVIGVALSTGAGAWLLSGFEVTPAPGPAATEQQQLDWLTDLLGQTSAALGVTGVITVLTGTFLSGFLTIVVGKAVLGRPVTLREALTELRPRLLPLLGLTIVYTLLVMVGAVFCLLPGIWLYVLFGLATPALVLEQGKIGQSLTRSRVLVRGSWWRVFGVLLLTGIAAAIISFVIQIPFNLQVGIGSFASAEMAAQSLPSLLLSAAGQVIAETIVTPFVAAATVLLYIDQRMRKEGMDIQLARAAGTAPR